MAKYLEAAEIPRIRSYMNFVTKWGYALDDVIFADMFAHLFETLCCI